MKSYSTDLYKSDRQQSKKVVRLNLIFGRAEIRCLHLLRPPPIRLPSHRGKNQSEDTAHSLSLSSEIRVVKLSKIQLIQSTLNSLFLPLTKLQVPSISTCFLDFSLEDILTKTPKTDITKNRIICSLQTPNNQKVP